ncbi:hypothetical protein ABFB09_03940 [Dehalogenimonas sp. THU2]
MDASEPDTTKADLLKKTTNMSVRLYGIMEFETFGIVFRHPTTLEVLTVPIGWMLDSFRGFREEKTPTQTVTDQVHGTITPDGQWMTSLVFTRRITHTSPDDGVFYEVTLKNVPISSFENELITANEIGSDILKHVEKVSYIEKSYSNGQLVTNTVLVSTDWTKDAAGLAPYILILFEEGEGGGLPPC